MNYIEELKAYVPYDAQEESDKRMMLELIKEKGNVSLSRESDLAHFSASSLILNEDCTKVLMVYHNIYQSWSWTGGHADGCEDMLELAMREAKEETGISDLRLFKTGLCSIENLPVWGHMKNGKYISSHIHYNFSYLFISDENQETRLKADENSGVEWIEIKDLANRISEKRMLSIYFKILRDVLK